MKFCAAVVVSSAPDGDALEKGEGVVRRFETVVQNDHMDSNNPQVIRCFKSKPLGDKEETDKDVLLDNRFPARHLLRSFFLRSEKAMIFAIPEPPKQEQGHIRQNRPVTKPPFCSLSNLTNMMVLILVM